ncbi:MAG TPA: prolyl oligopeptidase family serine peptidase [Anaerolineales bacterium]|nr:prolyl oligopeptidase family serine peptidase [Anaerolineales bacterium]
MKEQIEPGLHTLIYQEREQRYTLSIPPDYTEHKPVPLVVALHWGGVVTPFYSLPYLEGLVEPALRELGALILAPDCQHGEWTNPQSESDVLALVEYLKTLYNIDPNRIVLTGYSKGGAGTWYLAARNQGRFCAAIPVAGMPQADSARIDWHIPLYVIHSQMDNVVPILPTEIVIKELKKRGVPVKFVAIKGLPHYETGGYIPYLRETVRWLDNIWESSS